jgi:membrane-associated HD superfamily phosphohydrolase
MIEFNLVFIYDDEESAEKALRRIAKEALNSYDNLFISKNSILVKRKTKIEIQEDFDIVKDIAESSVGILNTIEFIEY